MKRVVRLPRPIRFTKEGYYQVKKKHQDLKDSRPVAVATLSQARAMGDLSENGFYKAAKSNLRSIDNEIARLEHFMKVGVIYESNNNEIGIGSKVTVKSNNLLTVFQIVGDYEADPKQKKISLYSPVGHALAGKRLGDNATVNTPSGNIGYKIIKIE